MPNLNKVMLIGNLTRDPELRHTPKGTAVAELSLAINRAWRDEGGNKQEETTFVEITFWGRTAELAQQYLQKGRSVYVEGRLQLDTWEDKDTGKKRTKMKIIGETMQFLGSGSGGTRESDGPRQSTTPSPRQQSPNSTPAPESNYQEDDDIPF